MGRTLLLIGFWTAGFLPAVIAAPQAQTAATDEASAIFVKHVRPLFKEKCAGCHGQAVKSSELSVGSRDDLLHGGKRGAAIAPGSAAKSLLVTAIEQTETLKMPPGQKLADQEIAAGTVALTPFGTTRMRCPGMPSDSSWRPAAGEFATTACAQRYACR